MVRIAVRAWVLWIRVARLTMRIRRRHVPSCPIVCLSPLQRRWQNTTSRIAVARPIGHQRHHPLHACRFRPLPRSSLRSGPYYGGTAPCPAGTGPYIVCRYVRSRMGIAPACACMAAVSAFSLRDRPSLFSRVQTASPLTHSTLSSRAGTCSTCSPASALLWAACVLRPPSDWHSMTRPAGPRAPDSPFRVDVPDEIGPGRTRRASK